MSAGRKTMAPWQKRLIAVGSLLLALPGFPLLLSFVCATSILVIDGDRWAMEVGLVTFVLGAASAGAGGIVFWHSLRSLRRKRSRPIRWPAAWAMAGLFGLCVAMGWFVWQSNFVAGLLFPPLLVAAASGRCSLVCGRADRRLDMATGGDSLCRGSDNKCGPCYNPGNSVPRSSAGPGV